MEDEDREISMGYFKASLDPVKGSEQRGTRPVLVVSNVKITQ